MEGKAAPSLRGVLVALDECGAITDNSHIESLPTQIAKLQASRKRMLVAADAERRRIERDLHEGVQQQLVALSVNLQLADGLMNTDPAAARILLGEIRREVKEALDDTRQLALRIYPPLEAVGLATTLRSAAAEEFARLSTSRCVRAIRCRSPPCSTGPGSISSSKSTTGLAPRYAYERTTSRSRSSS